MAKIDEIEAEVRSKVQEALDEFVQSAKERDGNPELDSNFQAVQVRIIGILEPRDKAVGSSSLVAKRNVKV